VGPDKWVVGQGETGEKYAGNGDVASRERLHKTAWEARREAEEHSQLDRAVMQDVR